MALDATLAIIDSSKVSDYMACPRRFMFRHVFGWTNSSFHLKFGERFHLAIEFCLNHGFGKQQIEIAMGIFGQDWPDSYEDSTKNKNILSAYQALVGYGEEYSKDDLEVLHTEVGGQVPISTDPQRLLAFKIDAIVRDRHGNIWALEHKTGSFYSQVWEAQWATRYQIHAYTHALRLAIPDENVRGVIVNGIFFLKKKQEFHRVRVDHQDKMQRLYLDEINYWIDLLDQDLQEFLKADPEEEILRCFSRKPDCCTSFNSVCPYYSICSMTANPKKHEKTNPLGFNVEFWNPLDKEIKTSYDDLKKQHGGKGQLDDHTEPR